MDRAHFEVVADVQLRHWWFVARRRIVRRVLGAVLPSDPSALVVDVGCGAGANAASLADHYRCLGIDVSADAVELARHQFPDVEYVCGTAPGDIATAMTTARAVLLMDVLEHARDDRAVLAPLVDALPSGAIVLLTVPADMRLWSAHDELLQHHRRYDVETLRHTWSGLPVETLLVSHFCARLYPLARLQRRLGRLWPGRSQRAWDMAVPIAPVNRLLLDIFAGEAEVLVDVLGGRRLRGYEHGLSLMALLRRTTDDRAPGGVAA
jgi:SAM-dependent methyltransferase